MKVNCLKGVLGLGLLLAAAGCHSFNSLPLDVSETRYEEFIPQEDFQAAPLFKHLVRSYGKDIEHERLKIQHLILQTETSAFEFNRNGIIYDGRTTADHLRKKYRKKFKDITTARDYIDQIATRSSQSGRYYLVYPGNGYAYHSRDLLYYELNRLEKAINKEAAS